MSERKRIAFLGTGIMGAPMATNLARADYDVVGWNRTPAKVAPLRAQGVAIASSAREAVTGCDTAVVMLSSGAACREVLLGSGGVLGAMREGALLIVMSSIGQDEAADLAAEAQAAGLDWLDAPVSGGETGARQAALSIMVGGEAETFERAQPILKLLGNPIHIGPAGCGALCKLINQLTVASTLAVVAEALLLAEASQADPAKVREALLGGFAKSAILEQHGKRMIEKDFRPGGPAKYQLKDTRAALEVAHHARLELPMLTLADSLFEGLVEHGDGELDHSAVIRELERRNGLL